ncbi:MAG TPA: acyl carrier protein [Gammaproteobacteria bacterium]|nr:acyl carrier protein [Gammaproteobacteria bacterium]
MHDRTAMERKIGEIFERKLNLRVPSPVTDLFESGGLDSLSFVELLLQLELEYGLRVPLQELVLADFRTVARIAGFVARQLAADKARQETQPQYFDMEEKCPA